MSYRLQNPEFSTVSCIIGTLAYSLHSIQPQRTQFRKAIAAKPSVENKRGLLNKMAFALSQHLNAQALLLRSPLLKSTTVTAWAISAMIIP